MYAGVFTALITPFTPVGDVDETALRTLVREQISAGVDGLVPMGTTGESPTVSHMENIEVIRIVIDEAAGAVPVIAGTGSNSTNEAVDMTLRAKELGASASLQVAPYYNKPNQEGIYRHYEQIARQSELPLIIYNIPGRTGKNIEPGTIIELASLPGIVGVKEASGSMSQAMEILAEVPDDFAVLSGDDNLTLPLISLGAHGVVSVASNVIPSGMKELVDTALRQDFDGARRIQYQLMPLFKAMFLDTNPIPVKYAYAHMHGSEPHYRLPLCPPSADVAARIKTALGELKLLPTPG